MNEYLCFIVLASDDLGDLVQLGLPREEQDLGCHLGGSLVVHVGIHVVNLLEEYLELDVKLLDQLFGLELLFPHVGDPGVAGLKLHQHWVGVLLIHLRIHLV